MNKLKTIEKLIDLSYRFNHHEQEVQLRQEMLSDSRNALEDAKKEMADLVTNYSHQLEQQLKQEHGDEFTYDLLEAQDIPFRFSAGFHQFQIAIDDDGVKVTSHPEPQCLHSLKARAEREEETAVRDVTATQDENITEERDHAGNAHS